MQIVALNSTCWYRVKSSDLVVAAAASNGSAPEWIYYGLRYQGDTKLGERRQAFFVFVVFSKAISKFTGETVAVSACFINLEIYLYSVL